MRFGSAFGLLTPADRRRDDAQSMALVLGGLFFAGSAIGALSLLLPHPASFNDTALWSNVALAFLAAVFLFLRSRRLPRWSMQVGVGIGTLVITRAVYYSNEPNGFYAFFYVWVVLYAFYFFGRLGGAAHLALLGGAYAWVLTQLPHSTPASRWVMLVGTAAVAGLVFDSIAGRLREQGAQTAARANALSAVSEVAHELARTTSESAAPAICDAAMSVTDASGATLWRPTADGGGLRCVASTEPQLVGRAMRFLGEVSGTLRAFTSRESSLVAEAEGNPEVDQKLVKELGVSSVLFQPVMRDDVPIAVLTIWWEQPVGALDEAVAQSVSLLSSETAIAIERGELMERLERAARTDDLTGLFNRRAWDEYLEREIARAKRVGSPLCVAMLDLDHFKEYNDNFGHQAGDRFLKQAAARWQGRVRETDLLARYGGEEFAIALTDCELEDAQALLERLRKATPDQESSSVGVVRWDGAESASDLVARADMALYAAKRAGRDRVVVG